MEKLYTELAEILEADSIGPEDRFKEFEAWDSLAALSTIVAVRTNYNVTINSEDLAKVNTVSELVSLIEQRKK